MKRSQNLESMSLRVGILVAVSMTLIFLVLFFPIRGVNPFSRKIHLYGHFDDVGGLKRNAPVYLSGMEVGSVESVDFAKAGSNRRLEVRVGVERKLRHLLHNDTIMKIISKGLLGDKFIELTPGSPNLPELADGASLTSEVEESMMADMSELKDKLSETLDKANNLLALAQDKNTNIGKLLHDGRMYEEMVGAMKEIRLVASRVREIEDNINKKILDPATKEKIDQTLASVSKVSQKMNSYTEKIDRMRFLMNFGAKKYSVGNTFGAIANMQIVPNDDRFYMGGIEYFNNLGPSTAADNVSFDVGLGFRVLKSPVFFWGGVKRTQVAGGLDARFLENETLSFTADAYHYERSTPQIDLGVKYRFLNFFTLTAGMDDSLQTTPFYHGGLTFTYDDQDLSTVLIKAKSGI